MRQAAVSEETISTPIERSASFQLVSVGEKQSMAFDFISNTILLFGADSGLVKIPLIEAADPVETMFEYQYKTLPYTNDGLKYSRHSLCAEVYV